MRPVPACRTFQNEKPRFPPMKPGLPCCCCLPGPYLPIMEILYVILGIVVVLLLLLAALRWSVVAAARGGHRMRDDHFRDHCDASGGQSSGSHSSDGD